MSKPRISRDKDVNDSGEPIFRPPEIISQPIKSYWKWIWIAVVALVIIAWAFLFWYFSNHQAPYSAPID
jgi:hypothetical protein